MILLKTAEEIEQMTHSGHLLVLAHQLAAELLQPETETKTIAEAVREFLLDHQAEPVFETVSHQHSFPAACCISVNEEAIHGVPGTKRIAAGDLVSIDIGCRRHGWCADAAWTYAVGELSTQRQKLLDFGHQVTEYILEQITQTKNWGSVSDWAREFVSKSEFAIVEEVVGHGIGRELHEDPQVGFRKPIPGVTHNFELVPGTVFTIEPVLTNGSRYLTQTGDKWTLETEDGSDAVHHELTVAVTETGLEILTPLGGGRI